MTERSPIKILSHATADQLQIIVAAIELGEPRLALNACKLIHELVDKMRLEIMGIGQDARDNHKED